MINGGQQSKNEKILLRCNSCTYIGKNVNALKKHVKIIHQGLSIQCNECEYICRDGSNIKRHFLPM